MFANDSRNNIYYSVSPKGSPSDLAVVGPYAIFFTVTVVIFKALSAGFSSVLTLSAGFQCLGFVLLVIKVHRSRTVCGLSAKTLTMYGATLSCRLVSTLVKNGYLPVDRTGDGAYQTAEICSLCLVAYLLWCSLVSHERTYQSELDTMPGVRYIMGACSILALFVHPSLNRSAFFDIAWTTACYMETVAVLPQLWMLSKKGGEVDGMTSHFVVLSTMARVCTLLFWYRAYRELRPKVPHPLYGELNMAGWGVILAHALQLLLACDFVYVYVKGLVARTKPILPGHI